MTAGPAKRLPLRSALLLACGFGLATGWGELGYRAIQRFVLGSLMFQSQHILWMTPISNVLLFGLCAVAVFAFARFLPAIASPRAFLFLFTSLTLAAPLTSYPRLHWAAGWLLAVGIGWRVSGWIGDPSPRLRALNRVLISLLATFTVLGLGYAYWLSGTREPHSGVTDAPDAPNVLLVVWDTVRHKSVGLPGGGPQTTPNLTMLERTGVSFDAAMGTSSWTLPSHASLFTGHFPGEFGASWKVPLNDEFPTLAEVLRDAGFDTAGFAGNLLYCARESGLARGFDRYEDYPVSFRTLLRSAWLTRGLASRLGLLDDDVEFTMKPAPRIRRAFLDWLDTRTDQARPFFAFLNLIDAHAPYTPDAKTYARFSNGHARATSDDARSWSPTEIDAERAAYEAEIASLDAELGVLLDDLEERGELDRTLIIVASDHGEMFGEHGLFGHGNALYRPLLHVPLVMSLPGVLPADTHVSGPVSLAEIPATVMDLALPGVPHPFPGVDLTRIGTDQPPRPPRAAIEFHTGLDSSTPLSRGSMSAVIEGDWYYILNGDGVEELFRLAEDPGERSNEAENEESVLEHMRSLVLKVS